MNPSFSLRRYTPTDLAAIAALAVAASVKPETACGQPDVASANEFEADYGHRNLESELWVIPESAVPDAPIAAFAGGQLRNEVFKVDGPVVAETWRGQGLGSYLLAQLEQDAADQDAELVEVGVRHTNVRGWAFLTKRGYDLNREVYVFEAHARASVEPHLAPGYTIVGLAPKHLLAFLMVMDECFPGYRLPSTPQRLFEPDKMKIFLALDANEQVAGAITAFFYLDDGLAYIYHLGVREAHRRKGLANALLINACDWLWTAHSPHFIGLSTDSTYGLSRRLIEPLGFVLQYSLRFARKRLREPVPVDWN